MDISEREIEKLAELARVKLEKSQQESLLGDLAKILEYVSQVNELAPHAGSELDTHRNIVRDDQDPHEMGLYTDKILGSAPRSRDGYIVVKKIIS